MILLSIISLIGFIAVAYFVLQFFRVKPAKTFTGDCKQIQSSGKAGSTRTNYFTDKYMFNGKAMDNTTYCNNNGPLDSATFDKCCCQTQCKTLADKTQSAACLKGCDLITK